MSNNKNVIIRPFQNKDFNAVANIVFDGFKSKFNYIVKLSESELYDLLIVSGIIDDQPFDGYYVAEVNHQVMGCISCSWIGQKKNDSKHKESFFQLGRQFGFMKLLSFYGTLEFLQTSLKLGECYIENVAVHKDARGLGIGSQLIDVCNRIIADHATLNYSSLHVVGSNIEAYKLYKRLGFRTQELIESKLMRKLVGETCAHYMIRQ